MSCLHTQTLMLDTLARVSTAKSQTVRHGPSWVLLTLRIGGNKEHFKEPPRSIKDQRFTPHYSLSAKVRATVHARSYKHLTCSVLSVGAQCSEHGWMHLQGVHQYRSELCLRTDRQMDWLRNRVCVLDPPSHINHSPSHM